jgi:hypothetical protein
MEPIEIKKLSAGKFLISFIAVFTAVSPYIADWNKTHIYNPTWPPHAKFHNAQTMVLGAFLGMLSIYCLWFRKNVTYRQKVNEATVLAVLYWLAQFPALFFPGSKLVDSTSLRGPVVFGVELNQIIMDVVLVFPLLALGYYLEIRRINRLKIS